MYSYGSRRLAKQTSKISAKAWQPAILVNVTPVTIDLANISRNWEVLETRFLLLPVKKKIYVDLCCLLYVFEWKDIEWMEELERKLRVCWAASTSISCRKSTELK